MEQDHRAVKQRYYPMRGFGSFESASRFCTAFDELRQYFRVRSRGEAHVWFCQISDHGALRARNLAVIAAAPDSEEGASTPLVAPDLEPLSEI